LVCLAGGGAGIGPPAERDPEMVREDVRNGLVSVAWAHDVYKVVLSSETLEIDEEATRALRGSAG
jgi:N-methylhydantoinase B